MDYMVKTEQVSKNYGSTKALDHVSMTVQQGDIYGLIGLNGAGKTTMLKIMSGLARQDEGELHYYSGLRSDDWQARRRISCLIEDPGLFPNLTAYEHLHMMSLSLGLRDEQHIAELLDIVGLADTGKKKVKAFSLGMKQRLGVASALVGYPDLVILDEPINGLDPQGIVEIRQIISQLHKERGLTFIISSHILGELSKLCTRYGILHQGVLVEERSQEDFVERCKERILLETADPSAAIPILEALGIQAYKVISHHAIEIYERLDQTAEINRELVMGGVPVKSIAIDETSLEDYFLKLTGGQHV